MIYPDTQCMVYLPTFTIQINQIVGKYTIHPVSGIWFNGKNITCSLGPRFDVSSTDGSFESSGNT